MVTMRVFEERRRVGEVIVKISGQKNDSRTGSARVYSPIQTTTLEA
jgi:hypothetical protein